jgi:acyl carrier protein
VPERPAAIALNREFEAVLRECLDGLVGPDAPLQEDSDLALLGIDSLTVVRLLVTLEEAFGVTIPDEVISFEIFSSPGALWNVISGLLEESRER